MNEGVNACVRADRERAAGYYSEMPFAAAQVLVEVPYLLAQAILFSAISYPMVHFEANPGEPNLLRLCALLLLVADSAPATTHQS